MRSLGKSILLLAALLAIPLTAEAVPIYAGHEYGVITAEGLTWEAAATAAMGLGTGWQLATIGDAGENAFVEGLLSTALPDRSHYWIGGTDAAVEGTWVWIDGTPFAFSDFWGGEPNNFFEEDFLAYDLRSGSWAWNDLSSTGATGLIRGYVAERAVDTTAVPEPASLFLLGAGAVLAAARQRRIRAR